MKKLLLILLCFPMIGFSQVEIQELQSYYYPPEESVSNGGSYFDGGITHVVPFEYDGHNYPDSINGSTPMMQVFGSLSYYSAGKIQSVFIDGSPFVAFFLNFTYNSNNLVETFNYMENGNGFQVAFIYDSNNNLIEKNSIATSSGNEYRKIFTYSNGKLIQMEYFLLPNITTPIQTDLLTYNTLDQLEKVELSNDVTFEYGYNSVTNFCESVTLFYNNNYVDTVITREYDGSGNMIKTLIKEYDLSISPPTLDSDKMMTYTYDSYNRNIKEEYWDPNTNQQIAQYFDYIYFSSPTSIQEHTTTKKLLKITDLLGRETNGTKNEILFYIYDDGTVEKRIVIE